MVRLRLLEKGHLNEDVKEVRELAALSTAASATAPVQMAKAVGRRFGGWGDQDSGFDLPDSRSPRLEMT